ncbi:MAG: Gfo/Idh/MocA family protein [Clostridia bacterium]
MGVCFQNRYNYTSQHVKSLLDSGSLGKVLGAKALVTWGRDAKYYGQAQWRGTWQYEGGGVLINQAIHTLDLLQWFLGLPVSVAAPDVLLSATGLHRG